MRITRNIFFKLSLVLIVFATGTINAQKPDSLSNALSKAKHDSDRVKIYLTLSEGIYRSDVDSAKKLWESGKSICLKNLRSGKSKKEELLFFGNAFADVLIGLGYLEKTKGNVNNALDYYKKGLKIYEATGNLDGQANVINNLGVLYKNLGDITNSVECYEKSIRIFEKLNNEKQLANSLHNIGLLYKETGDLEKALMYYKRSLELGRKVNSKSVIGNVLNSISQLYKQQGKREMYLQYMNESLQIFEESKDYMKLGMLFNNVGIQFNKEKNFQEAIKYLDKSIESYGKVENMPGLAFAKCNLANVYINLNQTDKAEALLLSALSIAQKAGFPKEISSAANNLKTIYEGKGNYKKALEMQDLYLIMRDSVTNKENQKILLQNQYKQEYRRKQEADSIKMLEERKVITSELKVKDAKLEKEKFQRIALYAGLLIVVIFALAMYNRFKITKEQKRVIELQKKMVEEKQKSIVDSINYAKRIQQSLMPTEKYIEKNLKKKS